MGTAIVVVVFLLLFWVISFCLNYVCVVVTKFFLLVLRSLCCTILTFTIAAAVVVVIAIAVAVAVANVLLVSHRAPVT